MPKAAIVEPGKGIRLKPKTMGVIYTVGSGLCFAFFIEDVHLVTAIVQLLFRAISSDPLNRRSEKRGCAMFANQERRPLSTERRLAAATPLLSVSFALSYRSMRGG